jgi:NDP-sugar pyrophosphorylase family protein
MQALILTGGLGTRLRDVVGDRPKTMALVAGKPFIEYLIIRLRRQGLTEILLCTGHMGNLIRGFFGDGRKWGVHIEYSQEVASLGTAGAIKHAVEQIQGPDFLTVNGDSILDVDVRALRDHHLQRDALATLALARTDTSGRYGVVELGEEGEVRAFIEKGQSRGAAWINGGTYVFNRRVLGLIPPGNSSLEHDLLPTLIGKGLYGRPVDGFFIDIGIPSDYARLNAHPELLFELVGSEGSTC